MRALVLMLGLLASAVTTFPVFANPTVERGEYLVRGPAACGSCHTPQGPLTKNKNDRRIGPIAGMELAGQVYKEPFGQVSMFNITPGSRIATWKTSPPRATTQAEDNAVIDEREGEDEIPLKQFLQELKQDGLL